MKAAQAKALPVFSRRKKTRAMAGFI